MGIILEWWTWALSWLEGGHTGVCFYSHVLQCILEMDQFNNILKPSCPPMCKLEVAIWGEAGPGHTCKISKICSSISLEPNQSPSPHSIMPLGKQRSISPFLIKNAFRALIQGNLKIIITSLMVYTARECFYFNYNLNLRLVKGNPMKDSKEKYLC